MTLLWLATRLVRAGGKLRAVLVVGGCAVGSLVLLVIGALPAALPLESTPDSRRLLAIALTGLTLPVVGLLATVTRVSATTRDRRLAALRLLGVPATATRVVAATEAALYGISGVLLGAAAFLLLRSWLGAVIGAVGDGRLTGSTLAPGPVGWLAGTAGVVVLTLVVAAFPGRAAPSGARPLNTSRPSPWRLAPLVLGLGLLTAATVIDVSAGVRAFGFFIPGAVAVGLGLPLATPLGVRLLADAMARVTWRPTALLAARRLQQEPTGSTRLLASLLVGLFVVTGALGVLAEFTTTPQYQRAERAATDGPQAVDMFIPAGASIDASALRSVLGVRALGEWRVASLACTPEEEAAYGAGLAEPVLACSTALVATCAELPALRISVVGCQDGRPIWLRSSFTSDLDPTTQPPTLVQLSPDASSVAASLTLPDVVEHLTLSYSEEDPNWLINQDMLLLPPGTAGVNAFTRDDRWAAVLNGGQAARNRFIAAASTQGLNLYPEDLQPWNDVQTYRALLNTMAAVVLGVGLLALLITGIDRAVERRRHLAALAMIGVPGGVVRRSQFWQLAVPLALGLPLAVGAGLLAAAAYLASIGDLEVLPWAGALKLGVISLAGGLIIALATVTGLGGRVRPTELRQE